MDAPEALGLFGVAAALGAQAGLLFRTRRARVVAAFVGFALALASFFPDAVSLASFVYAFWDVPAIPTLYFAVYFGVFYRRNAVPRAGLPKCWRVAFVLFGAALYATELNFVSLDVYRLGYSQIVALAATVAVVVAGSRTAAALAAVAFVATSCGLYANFFDAILDFGCWIALVVGFLVDVVRAALRKKRRALFDKNASTP